MLAVGLFVYLGWWRYEAVSLIALPVSLTQQLALVNGLSSFAISYLVVFFLTRENERYVASAERANQRLSHKNDELEHFASIASHDLNEPLNTVSGMLDIIREDYHDPANEELTSVFTYVDEAILRMRAKIGHLLEYSRLGNDGEYVDLDVAEVLRSVAQDGRRDVVVHFETLGLAPVRALPVLRDVFENLIGNALKFRDPDRALVVKVHQEQTTDGWRFSVADNGIGIAPERQESIFGLFAQLNDKTTYGGHGIGLTFCKKIVEAHGGRMWVQSAPGRGSTFFFTLPRR